MSLGIGSVVKINNPQEDDEWTSDMLACVGFYGVVSKFDGPCLIYVEMVDISRGFWFMRSECTEITEHAEIEKVYFGFIDE